MFTSVCWHNGSLLYVVFVCLFSIIFHSLFTQLRIPPWAQLQLCDRDTQVQNLCLYALAVYSLFTQLLSLLLSLCSLFTQLFTLSLHSLHVVVVCLFSITLLSLYTTPHTIISLYTTPHTLLSLYTTPHTLLSLYTTPKMIENRHTKTTYKSDPLVSLYTIRIP